MATANSMEKKYSRVQGEATAFALKEFECLEKDVIVSFSDHECIVDIVGRGEKESHRFIFFYEEEP